MKLTLGLYGVFLLLVAIEGNTASLIADLKGDMPHYLPWLIVAAVLGAGYDYAPTHNVATLFILLVVLGFVLRNYDTIKQQFGSLYSGALSAVTPAPAAPQTVSVLPPLPAATISGAGTAAGSISGGLL